MGEQQQHKKRPRNAEGSGGKKSSVLALSYSPVATVAPSAPAAPSPVAMAKPAPTVAVTSPLAAMPPAPAAPGPAAMVEGDMTTPAATVVVTSPVAAMPPSPAAPSSAAMVVDLEPTGPVATVKPVRVVKPEDEVAEQEDAAMAAGATEDVELAILALPKKSFHCAACLCPLKPPVFRCENEHFVCQACGGNSVDGGGANKHCGPCGREVSYTRSRFMDGVVDAYKVPCLYKGHGCAMDDIPYHSAADHKASCKHAPCYCFDCRFVGSPAKLVRHLASPSGAHAWPVEKIKYEVPHPFVVPASEEEDQRRLLVAEDGRVFLLAVGAGRDPGGRRAVTVVCVRGNADADADAKPLYTGVLWVDGPPAPPRQPLGCSFRLKATVASCSVPGVVDMDQGWLHAHVSPNMLHGHGGESGDCELHLRLCLTKLA
ncbi:uncharacterized protein LOC119271126 [Triticum dicoccoides]|uniref:uncharacterized protein LOC119271126 n=1 Tax=Triticum dicoccoides TaxID=85692 RepID=UPI00189098B9|nr:uncharacterized protein LOC119271126 [Triticum dicoccoides]